MKEKLCVLCAYVLKKKEKVDLLVIYSLLSTFRFRKFQKFPKRLRLMPPQYKCIKKPFFSQNQEKNGKILRGNF
jgi:hypothetical protein